MSKTIWNWNTLRADTVRPSWAQDIWLWSNQWRRDAWTIWDRIGGMEMPRPVIYWAVQMGDTHPKVEILIGARAITDQETIWKWNILMADMVRPSWEGDRQRKMKNTSFSKGHCLTGPGCRGTHSDIHYHQTENLLAHFGTHKRPPETGRHRWRTWSGDHK